MAGTIVGALWVVLVHGTIVIEGTTVATITKGIVYSIDKYKI